MMDEADASDLYGRAMDAANNAMHSDCPEHARAIRDIGDAFWAYWQATNSLPANVERLLATSKQEADGQYIGWFGRTCRPE